MSGYNISVIATLDEGDKDYILTQLRAYNDSHSALLRESRKVGNDWQALTVLIRDETGRILGGILGRTNRVWGWFTIEYFWLEETIRGKGYGRQLISEAEQTAIKRGCHSAEVTTWSFQAPVFYQKMGYRIVGQLENHPPGCTDYWLAKQLTSV